MKPVSKREQNFHGNCQAALRKGRASFPTGDAREWRLPRAWTARRNGLARGKREHSPPVPVPRITGEAHCLLWVLAGAFSSFGNCCFIIDSRRSIGTLLRTILIGDSSPPRGLPALLRDAAPLRGSPRYLPWAPRLLSPILFGFRRLLCFVVSLFLFQFAIHPEVVLL